MRTEHNQKSIRVCTRGFLGAFCATLVLTAINSQAIDRVSPTTFESFEKQGWNAQINGGALPGRKPWLPEEFMFTQFQGDHSFVVESGKRREGKYSAKLVWKHTNPGQYNDDPNKIENSDRKAMFHGYSLRSAKDEAWYGFSMYFPSAGTKTEENSWLFFQLHGSKDSGEPSRNPCMHMTLDGDGLRGSWKWDADKISQSATVSNSKSFTIPGSKSDYLDRWIDFVVHVRYDYSSAKQGILEVWANDKKVVDKKNIQIGYNDNRGVFPSWGMYFNGNLGVMNNDHYLYLDEVRTVHGSASYQDVVPGGARESGILSGSYDLGVGVQAAHYDEESHPRDRNKIRDAGTHVGYIVNDTWIRFDDFDFARGAKRIEIRAGTPRFGGKVEIRLDSKTGNKIGTVDIRNTGSWTTYKSFYADLSSAAGTRDLYLVFKGGGSKGLFRLKKFNIEPK